MPSPARIKFLSTAERAVLLRLLVIKGRRRSLTREEIQLYYHASLAATVAAWDAYIKNIVGDFFGIITDTANPKYNVVHQLLRERAENALGRFNTPNWDNARNLV